MNKHIETIISDALEKEGIKLTNFDEHYSFVSTGNINESDRILNKKIIINLEYKQE